MHIKRMSIILEGFTPFREEDVERYDRLKWWLEMTWGDIFDETMNSISQ